MRLRYSTAALRQIEDDLSYTAARSPQGAVRLRERILAAAALVQDHPNVAQATDRQNTRRLVLAPYPYLLFYRVAADEVIITRFRMRLEGRCQERSVHDDLRLCRGIRGTAKALYERKTGASRLVNLTPMWCKPQ